MSRENSDPTESRSLQIKSFDADSVRSNEPHIPSQLLFVDGPSLGRGDRSKSRTTRSALIRRRLSEKRNNYRQEEEARRQGLIAERQGWRECTCQGITRGQATRHRPMGSPMPNGDGIGVGICSNCGGGRIFVSHQAHGNASPALPAGPSTGKADPFASVDPTLRPGVDGLLQFAVTNIWPNFRRSNYAMRCYQSWVAPNWDNKLFIYSTLWAASYHRDVLRISYGADPVLDIKDQLYYKGLILSMLRENVTEFTKEEWRDGVIMAILYLAVNETERRDLTRDPSPFTPPFTDMQSLSFYGSRDYHTMHWGVVCNLLRQLGGIHTVKAFALGWLISLSDLMSAAHSLTKPLFPMVDIEGNTTCFLPPLRAFPFPGDPSRVTNLGFRSLLSARPPVKEGIVDVLLHLSVYSMLIQGRYRQQLDPEDCDRFADFRNQVHHALFSLPDEHDPVEAILDTGDSSSDDSLASHELYQTCRLAVNLYATHVTFPVPRSSLLRATIIPLLTKKLKEITKTMSSPLLLWCATVAAIAAEEMSELSQLTTLVKELCLALKVTTYIRFLEILQSFAWVEVACCEGCHRLWERLAIDRAGEELEMSAAEAV
ncbi:hypothetical protein F1880_001076 [Penicillium rolfsii]|nr:hypothetical protein F1880_001076 [Penicillium rolfsii]